VEDSYSGRTPFHRGGVLLRNSRPDVVRRLLERSKTVPDLEVERGCSESQGNWVLSIDGDGDADRSAGVGVKTSPAALWPTTTTTTMMQASTSAASASSAPTSHWPSSGWPPSRSASGGGPFDHRSTSQGSNGFGLSNSTSSNLNTGGWSPRNDHRHRRPSFCKLGEQQDSVVVEVAGPTSFRMQMILGKGSFGEVYRVLHKKTGQVFAMKVLRKSKIMGRNLVRYAMTERNLLSYIRHPFIVRLHYAFQTSSCLVLVLQYCSGGSLSSLISREGFLPEAVAKLYLAEIYLAIEHLHDRQVVYRDLKPENVVLDDDRHALLTDFGLSKEGVEGLQGTRSFCGSVAYLAPEILARKGHGPPVDLYGLGVLFYESLAGHPPFYSRDREQLFRNIASATLVAPSRASPAAARLIAGLMHRDPAKRLGAQRTAQVRSHIYFLGMDWDRLLQREVAVPPLKKAGRTQLSPGSRARKGGSGEGDKPASKEKVQSPFEGPLARVTKAWVSKEQEIPGWEFATPEPSPKPSRRSSSMLS